jgi:hypothetical protein
VTATKLLFDLLGHPLAAIELAILGRRMAFFVEYSAMVNWIE